TFVRYSSTINEYGWRRIDTQLHSFVDVTPHQVGKLSRCESLIEPCPIEIEFTGVLLQSGHAQCRLITHQYVDVLPVLSLFASSLGGFRCVERVGVPVKRKV